MEVYEVNSSQIGYLSKRCIKQSIVEINEHSTLRFIINSVYLVSPSPTHLVTKPS